MYGCELASFSAPADTGIYNPKNYFWVPGIQLFLTQEAVLNGALQWFTRKPLLLLKHFVLLFYWFTIRPTFLASENNQGTGQQNVWTLIVKRQCFIPGLGFAAPAAVHSGKRQWFMTRQQ